MQLRQGCRQRTPWWCWMVLVLSAAATLPGAALLVADDEPAATAPATSDTPKMAADDLRPNGIVRQFAHVYNVADLLGADDNSVTISGKQRFTVSAAKAAALDALVRQLQADVLANTWDSSGGSGAIEAFAANLSLVVCHTAQAHLAVHNYLNNLREQRGLSPCPDKPPARCPPHDDGEIQTRTYAVADLVIPVPSFCSSNAPQSVKAEFNPLIHLITSTVEPSSWSCVRGRGTITTVPTNLSLVIEQTASVHQEISELLGQLRRLQDIQVTVETKFLGLPQRMFERIGRDFPGEDGPAEDGGEFSREGWMRVSETQVSRLLSACQADDHAEILQSPKLTLFNGQLGKVCWQDHGATVMLQYQGVVAADGKSVQLTVMLGEAPPESSPRGCAVRVPDGGALLLDATDELRPWADAQARGENASILHNIPYVPRLFQPPPQWKIDRVVLLITPRIVIAKEEASVVSSPREHP